MDQVHLIISGNVQGVFYRASCQDIAVKYGLKGWVKNLVGGPVEVLAQGNKKQLEQLIEWCRKGPPHAHVTDVKIEWEDIQEQFINFDIAGY